MLRSIFVATIAIAAVACGSPESQGPNRPTGPASSTGPTTSGNGGPTGSTEKKDKTETKSDVGNTCSSQSDCSAKACVFDGKYTTGKCSKACESFSDCPSFWKCDTVSGGSGNYCIPDGVAQPALSPQHKGSVGDKCEGNATCQSDACIFRSGDDFGYCTKECESFADCPSFWECESVGNAAGKFCKQK